MGSKLYVGNLSYNTTSSDLEQLCGQHGTVQSAEVIPPETRARGDACVEQSRTIDQRVDSKEATE